MTRLHSVSELFLSVVSTVPHPDWMDVEQSPRIAMLPYTMVDFFGFDPAAAPLAWQINASYHKGVQHAYV